eukprot:TRINITY_DN29973_c2_g1_i1.p1 TRINITY_DN29973_c2_g1~~TRINITY_DN29973_c2_g1_i1.p1  ORF type:complete len:412 (+),score=103.12 TRINITY_DN29973_c2_g1_i1:50-1285(+)
MAAVLQALGLAGEKDDREADRAFFARLVELPELDEDTRRAAEEQFGAPPLIGPYDAGLRDAFCHSVDNFLKLVDRMPPDALEGGPPPTPSLAGFEADKEPAEKPASEPSVPDVKDSESPLSPEDEDPSVDGEADPTEGETLAEVNYLRRRALEVRPSMMESTKVDDQGLVEELKNQRLRLSQMRRHNQVLRQSIETREAELQDIFEQIAKQEGYSDGTVVREHRRLRRGLKEAVRLLGVEEYTARGHLLWLSNEYQQLTHRAKERTGVAQDACDLLKKVLRTAGERKGEALAARRAARTAAFEAQSCRLELRAVQDALRASKPKVQDQVQALDAEEARLRLELEQTKQQNATATDPEAATSGQGGAVATDQKKAVKGSAPPVAEDPPAPAKAASPAKGKAAAAPKSNTATK